MEVHLNDHDDNVKGKGGTKKLLWTPSMDRVLIDTLTEELKMGNRGDNGWKKCAYEKVVNRIERKLGLVINTQNVRSRVKIWKTHHLAVKDCLTHNGFTWDDTLKMVTAPNAVWNEYLKTHKKAAVCRTKHFVNWDEIVPLLGFDHSTRFQASTARCTNIDTNTISGKNLTAGNLGAGSNRNIEDAVGDDVADDLSGDTPKSTPSPVSNYSMSRGAITPSKRKWVHKDEPTISSSLESIAESMKSIAQAMMERTRRVDVNELLSELKKVPDIDTMLIFEAAEYLLADFNRASLFFALSVEEKKIWLTRRFPQQVVDDYA